MKTILVLVLALLALSGCAHGVGFEYDPSFTDLEQTLIQEAISDWPDDVYPDEIITIRKGPEHLYYKGNPDHEIWGHEHHGTIELEPLGDKKPQEWRRAITHELGHAIGLPHIDSRPSIMQPLVQDCADRPTADDLRVAKRARLF